MPGAAIALSVRRYSERALDGGLILENVVGEPLGCRGRTDVVSGGAQSWVTAEEPNGTAAITSSIEAAGRTAIAINRPENGPARS